MGNDPYFGIPIPEVTSDQSSSSDVIHTIVPPDHQVSEHNSKWTKDHPLENIIGALDRPNFSTNYNPSTSLSSATMMPFHIIWELVPPPDKAFVITLKWIYKVKLDELGGILKNKARLVARGYRQEEGIDFEESFASGSASISRLSETFSSVCCHMNMVILSNGYKPIYVHKLKKLLCGLKQAHARGHDMLSYSAIQLLLKWLSGSTLASSVEKARKLLLWILPWCEKSNLDEDKEGIVVDLINTIVDSSFALTAFADADHAGCQDTSS
ncbi:retrovirus-related pol polyprotein from transposon TNT 1-94 [Tanacetum coccineum]